MFASFVALVALVAVAAAQQCYTCATPGVTSFFDGCNTCTCGSAGASCTELFCTTVVASPDTCTRQCDGFVTTDGCTCVRQQKTKCPATPGTSKCLTCATLPAGRTSYYDGCNNCNCGAAGATCTRLFCTAVVSAPDTCTRQCDGFVTTDGCTCVGQQKTACPNTNPSKCLTCATLPAGRTSFFDGCNTCTCGAAGASCTRNACAAVVADPSSCQGQCDGFVTTDGCTCYAGLKANCKKCGCDDVKATCERGLTCVDNKCQPLIVKPPPVGALDGSPMCVRTGGSCCGSGASCATGQVCDQNVCVDAASCGDSDSCASNPCKFGETCVPEKKFCITTPCPQYRCEKPTACAANPCAADEYCEEEPKNCITTPCPQYKCTKTKKCGCDDKTVTSCGSGLTCRDNKCQPLIRTPLPPGAADGTPICLRTGGGCCGGGSVCATGQVCDKNQCVAATTCPAAPAGKCLTCATLPKGKTSYYDGCNTCSCSSSGGPAACTKRACIQVLPDPKSCKNRCDGSVTVDDAACGVCTCMGGKRTNCTKCNGTCQTSRSGKISCLSGIFNREDEEGVPDEVFEDTPDTRSSASVVGTSFAVLAVMISAL